MTLRTLLMAGSALSVLIGRIDWAAHEDRLRRDREPRIDVGTYQDAGRS